MNDHPRRYWRISAVLHLLFLSIWASANLVDPPSRLSCADVNVRQSCALSYVDYDFITTNQFLSACVGLSVLVGEGIWPYKHWSTPKRLETFTIGRYLWIFDSASLRLEGDIKDYATSEIFCPAESVDATLLTSHNDQLADRDVVRVGDSLTEDGRPFLIDAIYVNRSGYVYASLRDPDSGQTISRTLN